MLALDEIQVSAQAAQRHAEQTANETDALRKLAALERVFQGGHLGTAAPLLPALLRLKGKPYTLDNHFAFEDLFRFNIPPVMTFMAGRQVSKSTSMAAHTVILSAAIKNFSTLCVMPLYEQTRRFSTLFVQPFIEQSPLGQLLTGPGTTNSVLQRDFRNGSRLLFSFAYLNADRVRGVSCDRLIVDEVQDMSTDHIPIIKECLSASDWRIQQFTGTPKTLDNTLEKLWGVSSQAEWFIPCTHCTTGGTPTWNIPTTDFHIEKMIGPYSPDISESRPGTVCYKCGKPISPRHGRWVHRYPKKCRTNAGYHIPQIIMPMHYARPASWAELLAKMSGAGNTPVHVFYNEVLGESYDTAAKLVTQTELDRVSNLGPNSLERAKQQCGRYKLTVLGIDWGGGGEKQLSFTTLALLGLCADGSIECPWGKRLLTPHDHLREAKEIFYYWQYFRPALVCHDYTGAGSLRETFLVQSGVPSRFVMPCMYVRSASQTPCYHVEPSELHPRSHYRVDKSRTLLLTCAMIKCGRLRFFDADYKTQNDAGLIADFLALVEEKTTTMAAGELYRITRQKDATDDFAHAVNLGCVGIWHRTRHWPRIDVIAAGAPTESQQSVLRPASWEDSTIER